MSRLARWSYPSSLFLLLLWTLMSSVTQLPCHIMNASSKQEQLHNYHAKQQKLPSELCIIAWHVFSFHLNIVALLAREVTSVAVVVRTAKPATSAVSSTEVAGSRAPAAPEGAPLVLLPSEQTRLNTMKNWQWLNFFLHQKVHWCWFLSTALVTAEICLDVHFCHDYACFIQRNSLDKQESWRETCGSPDAVFNNWELLVRHTVAPLARLQPRETALVIQVLSSQSRQDDPDARSLPELRSSRARKRKGWPVTTSRANWSHLQSEWAQLE